MARGGGETELVYVGPDTDGAAVERLRAGLASVSVAVVDDLGALDERLGRGADCVVVRHDLPDGTGFDAHELARTARADLPVVLLAEPTGDVAATAVERGLAGFVPLTDDRPRERLVETVERVLAETRSETVGGRSPDEVRWKADILDQLFERLPVHLYVKDAKARHVLVSQAHVEDPSSVLGRSDLDSELVPEQEARAGYEDDLEVLATGGPILDREEYYPSRDEWYLTSKVPRYDGDDIVGLIGVSREITERRKAQERLEALNERLEKFVSVASHDLRNPLTVARGRVEHERQRRDSEHLAAADRALSRMESLIDDLLTLASGETDVQQTDRLQLSAVARSCWADVPTDGATLTVETDLEFEGASGRVRQLFENLFRNCMEHGSTGGGTADDTAVHVRVGSLPSGEGFFVADDGPGVPESEQDTVFESGYTTCESGTGFGLSIVEDVAEAHGWRVDVTTAESGGARFEVTAVDPLD